MDALLALAFWTAVFVGFVFSVVHEIKLNRGKRLEAQRRKSVAKREAYWKAHPEEYADHLEAALADYREDGEENWDDDERERVREIIADLAAVQARLAQPASVRN